jgi:hypothetical protein
MVVRLWPPPMAGLIGSNYRSIPPFRLFVVDALIVRLMRLPLQFGQQPLSAAPR